MTESSSIINPHNNHITDASRWPPASDPSIRHIAVYGSLRPDDNSGKEWTKRFVHKVISTQFATVSHCKLYHNTRLDYPFAVRSSDPHHRVTVALLQFNDSDWCAKLSEADEIENYFVDQQSDKSEYHRHIVKAELISPSGDESRRTVRAYMYFGAQQDESFYSTSEWRLLPLGDWMKRSVAVAAT